MAIGRSFQESLQKALRSMELKINGLDDVEIPFEGKEERQAEIKKIIAIASPNRIIKFSVFICCFATSIASAVPF